MKRSAAIFDMDGTLCNVQSVRHHVRASPKDFDAFHEGSANCPPHEYVAESARAANLLGNAVLVVTGRMEGWRDLTVDWLNVHNVPFEALLMRKHGDFREDVVVKREILELEILPNFRIVRAFDDNPAIIKLWRAYDIDVVTVPGWEAVPTPTHRAPRQHPATG
jgi:hypothetical protein